MRPKFVSKAPMTLNDRRARKQRQKITLLNRHLLHLYPPLPIVRSMPSALSLRKARYRLPFHRRRSLLNHFASHSSCSLCRRRCVIIAVCGYTVCYICTLETSISCLDSLQQRLVINHRAFTKTRTSLRKDFSCVSQSVWIRSCSP